MKYVIRKVPERNTEYLERLLPDAEIYCDDKHIGALESFIDVLRKTEGDAVYVQDDMLLCKDFIKRTREVIEKYPYAVIVFSNFTHDASSKDVVKQGWYNAKKGCWLLCTYIPEGIKNAFLKWWDNGEWKSIGRCKQWVSRQYDDAFFSRFLLQNDLDVFVTVPNLAGHPKNKSVIDSRAPKTTPNFDFDNMEV